MTAIKMPDFRRIQGNAERVQREQDAQAEGAEDELPFGSEQALADNFANVAGDAFRWTPGLDWMVNKGTHWTRDLLLTRYNAARRVCTHAASEMENEKHATKVCAAATSNALLSLARSAPHIATAVEAWDAHPMLLNTPGEVIDLENGRTVSRKGLLFTQVSGVAPASMKTPLWDKFIADVFSRDLAMVEFIQRMAGYSLTGSTKEQKLFFAHGVGSNGKSVYLDTLRSISGTYAHNLPSEALMTSRNEGHPTMFASLHGKRLAISSEIEESAHWAESKIKQLTGDETLTARFMKKDFFTFPITHKHVVVGNFRPRLKGDDFAMVRRIVLIPFMQRFEGAQRDDNLRQKLRAEYPGILNWFIEGARKWAAGGLAIPESVTKASHAYMSEMNDMQLWQQECCTQNPGLTCAVATLYASFAAWKVRSGEHPSSVKAFSQRLERTHTKSKTRTGMVFEGLTASAPDIRAGNAYVTASRGE